MYMYMYIYTGLPTKNATHATHKIVSNQVTLKIKIKKVFLNYILCTL